ncbi:MAG: 1-acyl-sn-glycerol-3-phosphate acyltransferase [Holosporales bacterium]|jgi:1-acyl-sn-glycerol-3-phosphate acyltransferase|nr:1-acyl-sn-glycerol-3-phosphate acyltransferase [Holosporales bacterium]
MKKVILGMRSFFFMAAFYIVTAVSLIGACWVLLLPERYVFHYIRRWSRSITFLLKYIMGITPQVSGLENIPTGPALIAMRHESVWETVVMFSYIDHFIFVVKEELLWIPFFGFLLKKLRCISLRRNKGGAALRTLVTQGKERLEQGYKVLIFPEGTRMAPGSFRPFNSGLSFLYEKIDVPVIPAVLNSGCVWPRRRFYKYPGTVTLQFLPAISPGMSRDQFLAHFKCVFTDAYQKLEKEPMHVEKN